MDERIHIVTMVGVGFGYLRPVAEHTQHASKPKRKSASKRN